MSASVSKRQNKFKEVHKSILKFKEGWEMKIGNCSTRFKKGTAEGEGPLNSLKRGESLTVARIHHRPHLPKEVSAPIGAKAVGYLAEDGAQPNRLFAGVVGRRYCGILKEQEQIIPDPQVAFLQPDPIPLGGRQG